MAEMQWADGDVPMPRTSVKCAHVDGEAVLYDVASGRSLLLNDSAAQVWTMLGRLTVVELADQVAAAHGIDAARVHDDLRKVLQQLEDAGVVGRG